MIYNPLSFFNIILLYQHHQNSKFLLYSNNLPRHIIANHAHLIR